MFEYNRIGTILFNILVPEVGFEPTFDTVYKTAATEILRTILATRELYLVSGLFNDVAHPPSTYISTNITMTFSIHRVIISSLRTLLTYNGVKRYELLTSFHSNSLSISNIMLLYWWRALRSDLRISTLMKRKATRINGRG